MQKLLQAGVAALVLTGFAFAGPVVPAAAAPDTYHSPGVTVHVGPAPYRYRRPIRHRVRVCTITWRRHHTVRVRTCRMVWRRY